MPKRREGPVKNAQTGYYGLRGSGRDEMSTDVDLRTREIVHPGASQRVSRLPGPPARRAAKARGSHPLLFLRFPVPGGSSG